MEVNDLVKINMKCVTSNYKYFKSFIFKIIRINYDCITLTVVYHNRCLGFEKNMFVGETCRFEKCRLIEAGPISYKKLPYLDLI